MVASCFVLFRAIILYLHVTIQIRVFSLTIARGKLTRQLLNLLQGPLMCEIDGLECRVITRYSVV